MTDLEITRLCAEAMGWKFWWSKHNHWNADGPEGQHWGGQQWYPFERNSGQPVPKPEPAEGFYEFDPLHDDAQAMALLRKMGLWIEPPEEPIKYWTVVGRGQDNIHHNTDLNRAICECVAQMRRAGK